VSTALVDHTMVATATAGWARGRGPPDRINQANSNDWSVGSNKGSSILRAAHAKRSPSPSRTATAVNKYSPQRNPNAGNNIASVRSSILSRGSTPQERFQNMQKTNNGSRVAGGGYSTNNAQDFARADLLDSLDAETMNTDLFRMFEEAFNITLRNNPNMLPGSPMVIESIKSSMFKAQQGKVAQEAMLRKQLDQLQGEMSNMDDQLSQQREELAGKKKEMDDIEATKKDLKQKKDEATTDLDEMTKHLKFLSKSRNEVEKALQAEVKAVEKERDALLKATRDRKKIQKVKEENKSLKDEVDQMSEKASKENQALKERKEELKQLEEKNRTLREENEATKKELEMEQQGLLEINKSIQAKKTALLESKKVPQAQLYELGNELFKAKKSNAQRVTSCLADCGESNDLVDDNDVRPFSLRSGDSIDGPIRSRVDAHNVTSTRAVAFDANLGRQEAERSFDEPVKGRSRSRSRSKSRRKNNKHDEEKLMEKQIDRLRMELEAARARNNIAVHDQEAREAESALRDQMDDIRTDIYASPTLRRSHRDREHGERYYSFLHEDREPTSPRYSRASPSPRRFRLEDDDDRPRSSRNTFSRKKFSSSPLESTTSKRSSFPYSERVARSTPAWRR